MNTARQLLLDNDNGTDRIKFDFEFNYEYENNKGTFTCRRCGKHEYRNGEFETIKMGDIFTHITHFPSEASPGDDNICTQCVDVNDNSADVKPFARNKTLHNNNNGSNNLNNNNNNSSTINNNNNSTGLTEGNSMSSNNSQTTATHPQLQHHQQQQQPSPMDTSTTPHNNNNNSSQLQPQPSQISSTITVSILPTVYGDLPKTITIPATACIGSSNHDGSNSHFGNNHNTNAILTESKYTINMVNSVLETSQNSGDSSTAYILSHHHHGQEPQVKLENTSPVPFLSGTLPAGNTSTSNTSSIITSPDTPIELGQTVGSSTSPGPNSKECDICKKVFKSNKIAQLHFQRVHEKVGRYCCHICGIRFSYRGSLDSHLASHTAPEITHNCPTCGQKFKEKPNLTNHMKIHSDNPKKFSCEFCPSGFSKRVNLRYHMKRKHPDQVVATPPPPDNGATTSNSGNSLSNSLGSVSLGASNSKNNNNINNNNNNTHSSTGGGASAQHQPPTAQIIINNNNNNSNKSNSSNSSNNNVTMSQAYSTLTGAKSSPNSKEKPQGNFKCEHCGRMFLFKNNLKAHLRTHTRDKKYTCEICEKSFIYKESLKNHMLLHSNELPYLCDICGKKFRDRSNRRKHVKNVHKYLFTNGDGTPTAGPGNSTTMGTNNKNFKLPAIPEQGREGSNDQYNPNTTTNNGPNPPDPGPTTKKKRSGKKNQNSGGDPNNDPNKRGIIKSTNSNNNFNNNNKKRGANSISPPSFAGGDSKSSSNNSMIGNNNKSVIVSMGGSVSGGPMGVVDQDRKIIMSPSPKSIGSPLEYSRLPVTVHVPASPGGGNLHQHYVSTSRNQNVIVKASPSVSSSPDMDLYHRNQNVIVYPKSKGHINVTTTDYPPQSTVISQTNLVVSPQQHHQAQQQQQPPPQQQSHISQQPQYYAEDSFEAGTMAPTYMTLPLTTMTSPGPDSSHSNTQLIYEFAPTQVQSIKCEVDSPDENHHHPQQPPLRYEESVPEAGDGVQYSSPIYSNPGGVGEPGYHIHHSSPQHQQQQQQHTQYWTLAPPTSESNNQTSVPTDETTPYTSSSTITNSVAVAYDSPITAASNVLNVPSYAQSDIVDPANSNFFYKDLSQFDFSYL